MTALRAALALAFVTAAAGCVYFNGLYNAERAYAAAAAMSRLALPPRRGGCP